MVWVATQHVRLRPGPQVGGLVGGEGVGGVGCWSDYYPPWVGCPPATHGPHPLLPQVPTWSGKVTFQASRQGQPRRVDIHKRGILVRVEQVGGRGNGVGGRLEGGVLLL